MRGSLYDAMQDEFLDIAWDRVFKVPFFLPNPFKKQLLRLTGSLTSVGEGTHYSDPDASHVRSAHLSSRSKEPQYFGTLIHTCSIL